MSIRVRASRSIFITLIAAGFVFAWRWVNSPTGDGANQKMENKNDVRLKNLSRSGLSSVGAGANGAVALPVEISAARKLLKSSNDYAKLLDQLNNASNVSTQDKAYYSAAISSLGPMLGESFKAGEFQFGQAGEVLLPNLRELMWPMLACQFGINCSAQNNRELFSSANHNRRVWRWWHT